MRTRLVVVLTVVVIGSLISSTLMEAPYRVLILMLVPPVVLQGMRGFELIQRKKRKPRREA
jgi:hypothetical protein